MDGFAATLGVLDDRHDGGEGLPLARVGNQHVNHMIGENELRLRGAQDEIQ